MDLGRVLVVGVDSEVGSALAKRLRSHEGVAHLTGVGRSGRNVAALNGTLDARADIDVCGDDADPVALGGALSDARADTIFATGTSAPLMRKLSEQAGETQRIVFVSALGAGDSEYDVPAQVYFTMRADLLDKSLAEAHVRKSRARWTIARPGPLAEDGGQPVCTEGHECYGTVGVGDLANTLVEAAESSKAIGRTLAIVDQTGLLHTAPYVRPHEFWEPLPFDVFHL